MEYIPRTLWFSSEASERQTLREDALLPLAKPLVVLGEPGMGKSRLLSKLADKAGVTRYTARHFINRTPQSPVKTSSVVIIDSLDEVSARQGGDAVDRVLQKLDALDNPRFIMSCRIADWQAATSVEAINEQYKIRPLQVHLNPLERNEQLSVLEKKLGVKEAKRILAHYDSFGLDFMGNPLTLELCSNLDPKKELPSTSTELFEHASDILRREHLDNRGSHELALDDALDAAGAACAALILTGNERISRRGSANIRDGEIQISEVTKFHDGSVDRVLNTRLFSGGDDHFSYCHRRIGEFLGAKWLAKCANTPQKRKRLLQLFQLYGVVPENLRGLHAWLAHDHYLVAQVIAADPMGVIEYGDADALTPEHAVLLLRSLKDFFAPYPHFRKRSRVRASPLFSSSLSNEVDHIVRDDESPLGLREFLVIQMADAARASVFQDALRYLLLKPSEEYSLRCLAGDSLAALPKEDWAAHIEALRCQADRSSTRLAFELMQHVGIASFSDKQVVEVILAYDGLTLQYFKREAEENPIPDFWGFADCVPIEWLDNILDTLSYYNQELLPEHVPVKENNLLDLAHLLILRRLESGSLDPWRLWTWLTPYLRQHSYHRPAGKAIRAWIAEHDEARRTIQRHVFLDNPIQAEFDRLQVYFFRWNYGLDPSEDDVIALLTSLDPDDYNDKRWFDLLQLIPHDKTRGRMARDAAKPFAAHDRQLQEQLERLATPGVPEWETERVEGEHEEATGRAVGVAEDRAYYRNNLDKVRAGEIHYLRKPALKYFQSFNLPDSENSACESIENWLGTDLAQAVYEGFEKFLAPWPVRPSALRMAIKFANDAQYIEGYIVVAALNERLRTRTEPFEDLPDERLIAGTIQLWHRRIGERPGLFELLEQLESELQARGALECAHRLYVTPQIKKNCADVNLYPLRRSNADGKIAAHLAVEWLDRFSEMSVRLEAELVDYVLASKQRHRLCDIGSSRRASISDDQRRKNWDAVQILVDFTSAKRRLGEQVESNLLWHLRDRTAIRWPSGLSVALTPEQMGWTISVFRTSWPSASLSHGPLPDMGTEHPSDAYEFLLSMVMRLRNDTSDEAVEVLADLCSAPEDSYTEHLHAAAAMQKEKRVELQYAPPTLKEVSAIINDEPAASAADLQAVVLDALCIVQSRLRGDDVDSYRGFYRDDGKTHKSENECRDEIIKMLRVAEPDLSYTPETHVADDKRVDIVVHANEQLILPIEVKGQWSRDLWTAADEQLDRLYVTDWRAKRGIYLVLWFDTNCIPNPPDGKRRPQTPLELQDKLKKLSGAARAARQDVVVLDLTRP